MDIQTILKNRPSEPPEIAAIKRYVAEHFAGRTVGVAMTRDSIAITVASAAFAGSLKNHSRALQAAAETTKRITFRIESK